MRKIILSIIILSTIGCDTASQDIDFREGTSSGGDACEPPPPAPMGTVTETWNCKCETSADCKPGLRCVPIFKDELRCLAPASGATPGGGGYITSCKYQGEDRALFYPLGIGNSEIFCSACLGCEEPLPHSLICQ